MIKKQQENTNYYELQKNICDNFLRYNKIFPKEKDKLNKIYNYITSKEKLNCRKNMFGHVTASGIIINSKMEMLLIFHRASRNFFQPGGHIDDEDKNVIEAVTREIYEETGLKNVELNKWHIENNSPINIDIHKIKARPNKNEGDHFHFDYMFIFKTLEKEIILQLEEVEKYKWVKIEDLPNDNLHIKSSIEKAIEKGIL